MLITSDEPREGSTDWHEVCPVNALLPDRGVAAIFGMLQIAVFLLSNGELHAIQNQDPFSGANVMARGLVGDYGGRPKVASPMYKQNFDLATGECLSDPTVRLRTFPVEVRGSTVHVELDA